MATLKNTFDSDFTPAVGDFIVEVSGTVRVLRKNTSASAKWSQVAEVSSLDRAYPPAAVISNPVAGAVYRFEAMTIGATVQADQ